VGNVKFLDNLLVISMFMNDNIVSTTYFLDYYLAMIDGKNGILVCTTMDTHNEFIP